MPYPSPMPEYQPLFHQVQNFIADQLNSDPQLSGIGIEFLPESQLDIEYGIKRNLGRQGMVGIVNTLKGQYGGHDQDSCAWEIESEIDVLETPTVRRAWLKQNSLSAGTTVDVLNYIQESLCGPASPTYGKFCPVTQEVGEDNGVVVGKAVVKTFAIADVSACVSGESNWHIRYATEADISALWTAIEELSAELSGSEEVWNAIEELSGDIDNLEYNFEWVKEQIQETIPQELSTKISYPVMEQNPYGGNEWILDPSPLDPDTPSTAKVKFGAYEESVPGLYTPYIKLGDNPYLTIDQNHILLGRTKLVNFPDMSAAISALDIDHVIRWFATSSQPNRWIINFGRSSSGGISFVSDSDHPTQSYIDIAGNLITAPGYDPNFQSRGLLKARAGEEEDNHLQYNQKGLAFVEEVSSVSQDVQDLSSEVISAYEEIPSIWRVWEYKPGYLEFTARAANSAIGTIKAGTPPSVSLEYSTDNGSTWQNFVVGTTEVELPNIGDSVFVRAKTTNTAFATNGSNYIAFNYGGQIAVSGNLAYILDKDGNVGTLQNNAFHTLFGYSYTSLVDASGLVLPWTTVPERAYERMFCVAQNLVSGPVINATTFGARACANMFDSCQSLTTAPELHATSVDTSSFNRMFYNCTSLTKAPRLNPTTMASSCYSGMFEECSSLNEIKIDYTGDFSGSGFTTSPFKNWVKGVSPTGTFYYNGSDRTTGINAIPSGWTVQSF